MFLQVFEGELVAVFESPITYRILLDCVICQMDIGIIAIIHFILSTRGPQVPFFEEITFHFLCQ